MARPSVTVVHRIAGADNDEDREQHEENQAEIECQLLKNKEHQNEVENGPWPRLDQRDTGNAGDDASGAAAERVRPANPLVAGLSCLL